MTEFTNEITKLRVESEYYEENKRKLFDIATSYKKQVLHYDDIVTAQRILTTLSDKHFKEVIAYISDVVNRALGAMYPDDSYRFSIIRKLYQGKSVHLNVLIEEFFYPTDSYDELDIKHSIGNGMAQVISYLFFLCMYQVSNARPIILIDEILTGFHEVALEYIIEITKVFAEEGFQFIAVEYAFEDIGTPVLVVKDAKRGTSQAETTTWEEVHAYFKTVASNGGTQLMEDEAFENYVDKKREEQEYELDS